MKGRAPLPQAASATSTATPTTQAIGPSHAPTVAPHHNMLHHNNHYSNQHHHQHHRHHQQPIVTGGHCLPDTHSPDDDGANHHQHQESEDADDDFERYKLIDRVRFKLFMSEFLGTFLLVYLGQSALTSFELTGTQSDTLTRQLATILAQGLAYVFASLLAASLSGAHLNPAYTFASAAFGRTGWPRALGYLLAQYTGAFLGAIFLHATYSDKLSHRHLEGLLGGPNASLRAHGHILSTGKLFSSYPPTEVSLAQLTISCTLATGHLVLLLLAVQDSRLLRVARSLRPLYCGAALSLILAAFSANGGPVWNPAQDFSPRLYIALSGWGSSAFNLYNFKYWWLCGLVAPHAGALLGFAAYRLLEHLRSIPGHFDDDRTHHSHEQYSPARHHGDDFFEQN